MAILSIIIAPDPRLKAKCLPVAKVDAKVRKLMDDMLQTMHAANGIGLAAVQVGVRLRVIVLDVRAADEEPRPLTMANPEIIAVSDDDLASSEGCLSLPDHYADVVRPASVSVRYLDHENAVREIDADGLLGTCIQHEIDHLDGILFVDHISALKRNIILRKLVKSKRLSETAAVSA